MALTPEEQAELAALEAELGEQSSMAPTQRLTADESAELNQLEQALGSQTPMRQRPQVQDSGIMDDASAALQGFGQGASLGYVPELQARTEQALNFILPESMGGARGFNTGAEEYKQLLERWRKADKSLQEQSPMAYGAGTVGGAITSSFVPGKLLGAGAKAIGTGAKLRKAALTGAAYGGAMNTEAEEGFLSEQDIARRIENAGIGLASGAAGEGLMMGGGAMLKKVGEKLKGQSILKQIGANSGQMTKIIGKKGELKKVENFVKDEGLMALGQNTDDVAAKTKQILDEDGPKIAELYNKAQQEADTVMSVLGPNASGAKISGPALADEILANAQKKYRAHANRDMVLKEIESAVKPLRDLGDNANIVDIHDYRRSLDENINWTQKAKERDALQDVFVDARNTVADKAKQTLETLDKTLGGNRLSELKALNQRYSAASTVNKISEQAVGREMAKAYMGAGVLGAGGAGLEMLRSGDPMKAAAVGAGTFLTRKYGLPVGYGMGRASSALGNAASRASRNAATIGAMSTSPWLNMKRGE